MASVRKEERSISEIFRECVREELQMQGGISNSNLLMRTRNLIADSARSASREQIRLQLTPVLCPLAVLCHLCQALLHQGNLRQLVLGQRPPKQEFSRKAIHLLDMYMVVTMMKIVMKTLSQTTLLRTNILF